MVKNELEYTHLGTRGLFASTYSDIRDDSPDEIVRKIQGQYPGVGIRMLKGHPKSQGLTLQRERSRQSLLRLDPTAALQRWLKSTRLFFILFEVFHVHNRDFKQSTTATATKTWENKRVHE